MKEKPRSSIGTKLYVFIILTVLGAAIGTAFLAHRINADQIDQYYKRIAADTAVNFGSLVDVDYLARLRKAAESDEFQTLREAAEKADDESMIQDYLEKHDLWEGYVETRADLMRYLTNIKDIKYLYIMACGDETVMYDMYLMDDEDNPLYVTGYYEVREDAFIGVDPSKLIEPTISTGDWGWLCSAYAPVRDSRGNVVCQIGCDFDMTEVMEARNQILNYIVVAALVLAAVVLAIAVVLVNRIVIRPINSLTAEMKRFTPTRTNDYAAAGVANLDLRSNDEINELYENVRAMQINIIDYLNDLDVLQKDKERAEEDIRSRDEQIGQISKDAYRDALTGVGSKAAYVKKVEELNTLVASGHAEVGLVMVDMNNLKGINDKYGHKSGDTYIRGCCHLICEVFKHSPVYRIGGDEFVVVLQGNDFEHRHELVEQLRNDYRTAMQDEDAEPWQHFSAAVGMAELASDDLTLDLVFRRADQAMYEDKRRFKSEFGSTR